MSTSTNPQAACMAALFAAPAPRRAPRSAPAPAPRRASRPDGPGAGFSAGLPAAVSAGLTAPTVHGVVLEYAPLDHAASTPALVGVAAAVETVARTYSSVHRGVGHASRVTSAYYEAAREEVARFVGAREGDAVVFTRNTTDSFNLLARSLPADTEVFVFDSEHHATLLPWDPRDTVRLPVPGSVHAAQTLLADALQRSTATHRLVVLTGASNVTGEYWPVAQLSALARSHRARVALDAAQLAPHAVIDLDTLGADYVAFSGHKVYAPYGAGVLAGRRDWLDAATPYLAGGGATAAVTRTGTSWHTGPARHEAGSPNVVGAVALAAACAALREHRGAVERHEDRLGARLLHGLRSVPGVRTLSIFGDDHERAPVVAFTVDGLDSALVSAALSAEHAIGVRDGRFCAHLLLDALLGDSSDGRGGGHLTAVRVSAGLANTQEHAERLVASVADLATHGPRVRYERCGDGAWCPVEDLRDLEVRLPW